VVKAPVWELLEDIVEFGWGESFHGDCLRSVAEGYPLPPLINSHKISGMNKLAILLRAKYSLQRG
jgi:hypothetical protein